jgi:FlaA1/EpsC-like NDP-sugar epimerase
VLVSLNSFEGVDTVKPHYSRYRFRIAALAIAGLPVFALIHYLAYWLRFDGGLSDQEIQNAAVTLGVAVVAKTVVFLSFRIYQSWNRYVSLHDLVRLAQATTASSLLFAATDYLFLTQFTVPRSIFLMDWGDYDPLRRWSALCRPTVS